MKKWMSVYSTKADIARFFGISRGTVYEYIKGIENEIQQGRYASCAIAEGKVNRAVFLDYMQYRKRLKNKNLRKFVPGFDARKSYEYCLAMWEEDNG